MSKENLSGFFKYSMDVGRFEGNYHTQIGSLYYDPNLGIDLAQWLIPEIDSGFSFQNESFASWLAQEMIKKGIVTSSVQARIEGFTLVITYVLAAQSEQQSLTYNLG